MYSEVCRVIRECMFTLFKPFDVVRKSYSGFNEYGMVWGCKYVFHKNPFSSQKISNARIYSIFYVPLCEHPNINQLVV